MQWVHDPNRSNIDDITRLDMKLADISGTKRRNI